MLGKAKLNILAYGVINNAGFWNVAMSSPSLSSKLFKNMIIFEMQPKEGAI